MGAWLSDIFAWYGYTTSDEFRRWLPLIVIVEILQFWLLWNWGDRGMIRLPSTPAGIFVALAFLPYWIGLILLSARRFRSAGISRSWLLPMIININFHIGPIHLNVSAMWALGILVVAALKPDIARESEVY